MSTQKKYTEDYLAAAQPQFEEEVRKRKEADAKLKEQIDASIDAAAGTSAAVYQQEIEQAPLDSRAQYDANAMREAITRKQIEESLANMGMTDSGMSSSMHTALAVQRSRADNDVRVAERSRIQAAQSAIDQIRADAEMQKAEKGMAIDQATSEWEQNAALEMQNSAMTAGATAYAADVEAQSSAQQTALDYHNKRAAMAQSYINKGQDAAEAWAQAYYAYPDTSTVEGVRYAYYNKLKADGYGGTAASAMSNAYVNVVADGGTEADAAVAKEEALAAAMEAEIRNAGIDPYESTYRRGAVQTLSAEQIRNTVRVYTAAGLSADATAYAVGKGYFDAVVNGDDATANQVGQVLAQCFSGAQLSTALLAAGLE